MGNALKAIILLGGLFQGTTAMGYEAIVSTQPGEMKDQEKIDKYPPKLICNGTTMELARGTTQVCNLEQGQILTVWRGDVNEGQKHECTYTLENNALKEGYCSKYWTPIITPADANKAILVLVYSKP